jgi:hypothetical protein
MPSHQQPSGVSHYAFLEPTSATLTHNHANHVQCFAHLVSACLDLRPHQHHRGTTMSSILRSRLRAFVSHSHDDAAWCHAFVAALREAGIDLWYDEHNLGYGRLMDEIERELRSRPIFMAVLSPSAVASAWVRREVHAAIRLHDADPMRVVLPVIAVQCELPLLWGDYKWIGSPDSENLDPSEAARRVLQALDAQPRERAKQVWEENTLFAALARCCTPAGLAAARHLIEFARQRGAGFNWGAGQLPSVSARFFVGSRALSVFTLYGWPTGKASFAITFEYLLDTGVAPATLEKVATQLRTIPTVNDRYAGLEQAEFRKRPALPIDEVLTQPNAVATIEQAIDELLADTIA